MRICIGFSPAKSSVHISHKNDLSHDVAVYEKKVLPPDKISSSYANVYCEVGLEIDIIADLSNPKHYGCVNAKDTEETEES